MYGRRRAACGSCSAVLVVAAEHGGLCLRCQAAAIRLEEEAVEMAGRPGARRKFLKGGSRGGTGRCYVA